jgi:exosome complex component CSL4
METTLLLPGQPLSIPPRAPRPQSGSGTYERGSHILSSLVGEAQASGSSRSVQSGSSSRFIVPNIGSTVLGRVTRVTPRQANISILIVDGLPCSMGDRSSASFANHAAGEDPMGGDFTGVIRSQDVRATEKDKIRMGDCFRPGDIVRATVVSLILHLVKMSAH